MIHPNGNPPAPDRIAGEGRSGAASLGVIDLSWLGAVQFMGPEAAAWLQGQLTNDIRSLQPGTGHWTALCTPKGRLVGDLHLFRLADRFVGFTPPDAVEPLRADLEKRHITEDFEIADASSAWAVIGVTGERAEAAWRVLGFPPPPTAPYAFVPGEISGRPALAARWSLVGGSGSALLTPRSERPFFWDRLVSAGAQPVDRETFDAMRIAAGIPLMTRDMDESVLLPEVDRDEQWVSYTKGCYLGQEAIARMRTYGGAVKHLRGLALEGDEVPQPAELTSDGKKAGSLRSAAHHPEWGVIALAYLRKEFNAPGTALELTLEGGKRPRRAVVHALPFRR